MTIAVHSGSRPGTGRPAACEGEGATFELVVAGREPAADDIVVFTLRDRADGPLPSWMPGAHVHVTGPTGIERQYSLCGPLDEVHEWRIAVLREPEGRGGSEAMCTGLRCGDLVGVRGPNNHFRLVASPRYRFIAGGVGIAPLVPMIRLAAGQARPWTLAYAGRRRTAMAFAAALGELGEAVTLYPSAETGRMDLDALLGTPRQDTAVYCCGPVELIDAVTERCAGWPDGSLHVERFAGVLDAAQLGRGAAFDVELARSGRLVHVADGQTILDAVTDAGVTTMSSCCEGVCATCETRVLHGTPEHRDAVLTAEEHERGDTMMICVSRASSPRLVLDL